MYKERRCFKRFKADTAFTVSLGGETFRAVTVDYSFDGFCIRAETRSLKAGDEIDVALTRPAVKGKYRVVWAREAGTGSLAGLNRSGRLHGSLKDFHLSDVLIGLQRTGKTGVFDLVHGSVHKRIYIQGGDMIFAASNQPDDRLGDMLLAEGRITREQYNKSVEWMKKAKKRQGAALVELGYIDSRTLLRAVNAQVEHIILSLFSLGEGNMVFTEEPLPTEEMITLKLSAANLVYRGIKRMRDVAQIRRLCPPADCVLVLSPDPLDLFQDLRLEESDKNVLSFVDGKRTFKEIVTGSGGDVLDTMKTIYALLNTRIIEMAEDAAAFQEAGGEEIVTAEDVITAQEAVIDLEEESTLEFVYKLEELHDKYRELGYYGILGVEKTASAGEIKKAYYQRAREFHPDRHFHLPEEMKDKLNMVFTNITSAYSTLIDPALRRKYDEEPAAAQPETLSPAERAARKFEEGKGMLSEGRYEDAAKVFGEAAYLDASNAQYHYYSCAALRKGNKHKEAERAIQRALRIEPANADYLAEAGHVFLGLGFPLRAKGYFNKALQDNPSNKMALAGLSIIGGD